MHKAMMLFAALSASAAGMAWLALSLENHWQQVKGGSATATASAATVRMLRILGALALAVSLLICLLADHATMAVLVWVMAAAAGALAVAFTLSYKPRWLAPLVAWQR